MTHVGVHWYMPCAGYPLMHSSFLSTGMMKIKYYLDQHIYLNFVKFFMKNQNEF